MKQTARLFLMSGSRQSERPFVMERQLCGRVLGGDGQLGQPIGRRAASVSACSPLNQLEESSHVVLTTTAPTKKPH